MSITFRSLMIVSGLLLALSGCIEKSGPENGDGEPGMTAFINVNVVAMTDENVLADQTVVVDGGVIVEVGPVDEVEVPDRATVIDGEGAYLMPGLADMHMHTREEWLDGSWPVSPPSHTVDACSS